MDCLGQRLAMMEVWPSGTLSCDGHLAVDTWPQVEVPNFARIQSWSCAATTRPSGAQQAGLLFNTSLAHL